MIDLLFATLLGTLAGILIGLTPGFGMSMCLLIISPFLIQQSLIFCLLFYCCASSASQYFGSVTTLFFKIPGETTSFPLLELLKKKNFSKYIGDSLFLTAFGSFSAAILSGILILSLYQYLTFFTIYLKTYITVIFCLLGFCLCIKFSDNKIWISLLLFILGWIVSKIGYDQNQGINFLTFDNIYLYGGIPSFPIIVGLYGIPNLFKMFFYMKNIPKIQLKHISLSTDKLSIVLKHYKTILRSLIGFITGLLPYIGSGMSSHISFFIDKKINKENYVSNAVASETANNSASISVLIPLIFLGIAIIPSEFLLLEILPLGNNVLTLDNINKYFTYMFVLLVLSNLLCFYLSWDFIRPLCYLLCKLGNWFSFFTGILLITSVLYIGYDYSQLIYYLIVFAIASIMGIVLSNYNLIPFIYAFMMQNQLENTIYKIIKIYF